MTALSYEFQPSRAALQAVAPRIRRELGYDDPLAQVVMFGSIGVAIALAAIVLRFTTELGSVVPLAVLLGGAVGVLAWRRWGVAWARRRRAQRLHGTTPPDLPSRITVDDDGIEISDALSCLRWRWPLVRRAVLVPQGVLILVAGSAVLVPLADTATRQALFDTINAGAASAPAT